MKTGLNPNRQLLLILLLGAVACVLLFYLPKTVVTVDDVQKPSPTSTSSETNEPHLSLSESQLEILNGIKTQDILESEKLKALTDFFAEQNFFDSAAYYSKQLALKQKNEIEWIRTGDLYYQAYTLSLNPVTIEKFAEETRLAYQQALAINPNQLHAKTNIAMTYVNSRTPMQAILMLRQVLDEDPSYIPAVMSMGALSMQSGQFEKAIARFEQVLSIDSTNLNAKLGLAYSLIEIGDKEQARTLLQELSKAGIENVLKNEIDKALKSLN